MLITKEAISGINTNTDKTIIDGNIKRYALFWFCATYFFFFLLLVIIFSRKVQRTAENDGSFGFSLYPYCASTLSIASDASFKASCGAAAPDITFSNSGIITSLSIWLASE